MVSECSPSREGNRAATEAAALVLGSGLWQGRGERAGLIGSQGTGAGVKQTVGPHGVLRVCLYPAPRSESLGLSPLLLTRMLLLLHLSCCLFLLSSFLQVAVGGAAKRTRKAQRIMLMPGLDSFASVCVHARKSSVVARTLLTRGTGQQGGRSREH